MEGLDITKIKRGDLFYVQVPGQVTGSTLMWVINVLPGEKLEVYEWDSHKHEPIRTALTKYTIGLDCIVSPQEKWEQYCELIDGGLYGESPVLTFVRCELSKHYDNLLPRVASRFPLQYKGTNYLSGANGN